MNQVQVKPPQEVAFSAIEQVLIQGNLNPLTVPQRIEYYNKVCQSIKLNPLTRPFEYLAFQGRLILYATKNCAEQLRMNFKIGITKIERCPLAEAMKTGVYWAIAYGVDPSGRTDEAMGVLSILGLKGVDLSNAIMKCETKAKRRLSLSMAGLSVIDESEIDHLKGARRVGEDYQSLRITPNDGIAIEDMRLTDPEYRIPHGWGDFGGLYLHEVPTDKLKDLHEVTSIKIKKAEEAGKAVAKRWTEFVAAVDEYIGELENQPIDQDRPVEEERRQVSDFDKFNGGPLKT